MAKLLIVDDDEISRLILGSILHDAGHIVLFAHDGEQALKQLRKHTFDAVLTDLAMPT
jgi:CheY-like chemotaxis protein